MSFIRRSATYLFGILLVLAALVPLWPPRCGAAGALALFVNGKASSAAPLVHDREVYVPVSALKAGGAQVTVDGKAVRIQFLPVTGGTYQTDAVEGRMKEWLFNGIWRVRVLDVESIVDPYNPQRPGWGVTFEIANGAGKATSQFVTGLKYPELFDVKEKKLAIDENDWQTASWFKELPPGGAVKHTAKFYYPSGTPAEAVAAPAKVLVRVDVNDGNLRGSGLKYNVKSPSLRIFLEEK